MASAARVSSGAGLPLTIFGVARACSVIRRRWRPIASWGTRLPCHGLRWIGYQLVDEATERRHMQEAVAIQRELTGSGAARVVHRARQSQHAPLAGGARRLSL